MTWNLNPPYRGPIEDFDPETVEVYTNLEHEPELSREALAHAKQIAAEALTVSADPDAFDVSISASGTCGPQPSLSLSIAVIARADESH